MSKVLDEFDIDLFCATCNIVTEHNVEKIDEENNGEYIGYYGECDICNHIRSIDEDELK